MAQVVRCTDCGAYYNGQYYSVCPHCKKGHAESVPKPEQTDAPQKPEVQKDEPQMYTPPQRGETRAYSDMPPKWKEAQEPPKAPEEEPVEELAPNSDESENSSREAQPLFTALRNSGRTIGRFSSAAENGIDPVVGWIVCVKGLITGRHFRSRAGRIGLAVHRAWMCVC